MKKLLVLCFQLMAISFLFVQNIDKETFRYNPHDFFAEDFNPPRGNLYRSANGTVSKMLSMSKATTRNFGPNKGKMLPEPGKEAATTRNYIA